MLFLKVFCVKGLKLGVMMNDIEMGVCLYLIYMGVYELFDLVLGFDSGYGVKFDVEFFLVFVCYVDIVFEWVVMVGDSIYDLIVGCVVGMLIIGVLIGMVGIEMFVFYVNVVLDNIGDISGWLGF